MNDTTPYKVGITHGDFNGIGYEVILKTLADERIGELIIPIIYGSKRVLEYYQGVLNITLPMPIRLLTSPEEAKPSEIGLIEVAVLGRDRLDITPGRPTIESGRLAVMALEKARRDLDNGLLQALVTGPIHKETTYNIPLVEEDGSFPGGHTQFFAATHPEDKPLMLFTDGQGLQVALMSIHEPLESVSASLSREGVMNVARRFERSLKVDFGYDKPRMAILGLNPHAGENGLIGNEEEQLLRPAVKELWETGMLIFGPYPADGFWGGGAWRSFDGILALYHDQGLIPFKMLAMNEGVNFTAGLPVVRTSPDHGTAFDIAGKGDADPGSFRAAIYTAIDILKKRASYQEITSNPLIPTPQKRYLEN